MGFNYGYRHIKRDGNRSQGNHAGRATSTETPKDCTAHALYDDTSVEVWADQVHVQLDHAVVHEILHMIFDEHYEKFATYNLYDLWITSMEKPFFKPMTRKEVAKWRRQIKKRLVVKRK